MSNSATSKEQRHVLAFPSAAAYLGFLLTCLDTPEMGEVTELYQQHLRHLHVPRNGSRPLLVCFRCFPDRAWLAEHVALANGGAIHRQKSLDREQFRVLSVSALLRAIRLQPLAGRVFHPPHLLVALWDADSEVLSSFLEATWNLGLEGVQVAFLQPERQAVPSHLIQVATLRRLEAFHAFCEGFPGRLELYAPVHGGRRVSRFYTLWGYRFPAPGLEQLVDPDRELVLMRPRGQGKRAATEWISFASGEVNFFRRAYDFVDLEISVEETPLIELEEDVNPARVPLELALVPRRKRGGMRLWQIDQQIDRQRRGLIDLERMRAGLAAGSFDEVYFAYRFDQPDKEYLNPRLVHLLQQRLGTLRCYDYAFCQPARGRPYHLVLANRSHRQAGFSLQPADAVYYQPAAWRRWGLNLFLPLNTDLAPRIEDTDALPLLQRILESSDRGGNGEAAGVTAADCAAILWEAGKDGQIEETRIAQAAPLLSQFRLLNSFQRRVAGRVEQATRQQLSASVSATRQRVEDQLDQLTEELLNHIGQRTEKLENSYTQLEDSLQAAERLLERVEPRIGEVRNVLLSLPDEWGDFIQAVIELHRSLIEPELLELSGLRAERKAGQRQLRALAVRGQDLSAQAAAQRDRLQEEVAAQERAIVGDQRVREELEQLHTRANRVFQEVLGVHRQLAQRLARLKAMEKSALKMQKEIDQIREREAEAKRRVAEVKRLRAQYQQRSAAVQEAEVKLQGEERKLVQMSLELAQRREELGQRSVQIAGQLQRIEDYLLTCGMRNDEFDRVADELTEQFELVEAHAEAISLWDTQRRTWENYLALEQQEQDRTIERIERSLEELGAEDRGLLEMWAQIRAVRARVGNKEAVGQEAESKPS